jgi:RHS repeat-associated protein
VNAAAQAAAGAAATPTATHQDALGRDCLSVADNAAAGRYPERTARDTEGQPLAVFDPLGRRAEEHCYRNPQPGGGFAYLAGTDMAGHALYHVSADGGARRSLVNVAGKVIRNWDARGHAFRLLYDAALRPVNRYVSTNGAAEILIGLSVYGEGQPGANLCGRLFRGYDMAGYLENSQYDYKGNLLVSVRQLAAGYHAAVDWAPLSGLTTAAQLDAAAAGLLSAGDSFTGSTVFDALNRPVQVVPPHSTAMSPDVIRPGYDEASLLSQVDVWLQQAAAPTALLDPATAGLPAVTAITYNARGQRLTISCGNGTASAYAYDPQTFRLANLTTSRPGSFGAGQQTVQDLFYYYDPAGNVTRISDDADTQDVIFFRNQRVDPSAVYGYDAIYRLVSATGREHLGQTGGGLAAPQQVTSDDSFRTGLPQPGDGNAMGTYTETYSYDAAGNILTMAHQVGPGGWTRRYSYTEPSQIVATETGNRLSSTSLPGDPAGGPFSGTYTHDQDGNMTAMPHLASLTWDEDDRLRSTARSPGGAGAAGGTPQTSYYVYNGAGQRVRKATDWQVVAGQTAGLKTERIYLGAIEIYREYAADGTTVTLQRETLHVTDGGTAIALVETRTAGADKAPAQLVRYQYGNLLGSSVLELDDQSGIISYEEYFPYGSTSYQAVAAQTDLPKRYRYTGKERDTENDLYYHGARYCAPWLGRWISCDPAATVDGLNLYGYTRDNPVRYSDPAGLQSNEGDSGGSSNQMALPLLGITNSAFQGQYPKLTLRTEFLSIAGFQQSTDKAGTLNPTFSQYLSVGDRISDKLELNAQFSVGSTNSLGFGLHWGPPAPSDDKEKVSGWGVWASLSQVWGQEPPLPPLAPDTPGRSFNPTLNAFGAYSEQKPNKWGYDINFGGQVSRWGSIIGVPVETQLSPFVGGNYFRNIDSNNVVNFEGTTALNLGLGGRQDITSSQLPISVSQTVGVGWQHTFDKSDYALGVELFGGIEGSPNITNSAGSNVNFTGGIRFGWGAINANRGKYPELPK